MKARNFSFISFFAAENIMTLLGECRVQVCTHGIFCGVNIYDFINLRDNMIIFFNSLFN